MKTKESSLAVFFLFASAVSGVALGCLVYTHASGTALLPLYTDAEDALFPFRGALVSLLLLAMAAHALEGVSAFCLLVLLRVCRLTLDCCLAFLYRPFGMFVWQMLLCLLLGYLYTCFARLSIMYAKRRKRLSRRQKWQYIRDLLFFCGLCTVIRIFFDPISILKFIIPKGFLP